MEVTIDQAGRLVIPREIRRRMGLRGGERLEISEANERIELRRSPREVRLVRSPGGILHAEPSAEPVEVDADDVREALERARGWPRG